MKVIVTDKYLNVRFGSPSVNAPCYQYLAPGSEIEVEEKQHKGDKYGDTGNDIWLKDRAGNYYWSGGVTKIVPVLSDQKILNYNNISPLPSAVQMTKGRGVTIGVIDTGCFEHQGLKNISVLGKNFIGTDATFEDTSSQSHGTFVCGIIAAGESRANKMIGVASKASLLVARVASQSGISDRAALLEGLKWLISKQPDIINCSFDFSPAEDAEKFKQVFTSDEAKNILWVAAGHDNNGVFNERIYYPALNPGFIAVGSLRKDILNERRLALINNKIRYLLEEVEFISTDRYDSYKISVGSSFASAFITGNLALIKSYLKAQHKDDKPQACLDFLDQHVEQLNSPSLFNTPFTIFKR